MKRSTKLIVAFLVVVAALAVTYRLMHRVPSADLEANVQMQQIITDAGKVLPCTLGSFFQRCKERGSTELGKKSPHGTVYRCSGST